MRSIRNIKGQLRGNRDGNVGVSFALMAPVLVGFVGIGLEVGLWYKTQMDLQSTSDAAAMAGARQVAAAAANGAAVDLADIIDAVSQSATVNGCTEDKCCWLETPTTFKTNADLSSDNGVSVVAKSRQSYMFSALFLASGAEEANLTDAEQLCGPLAITATGRSAYEFPTSTTTTTTYETTTSTSGGSPGCVLGLDTTAMYTVSLNNNANLNCGIVSNSRCQGPDSGLCTLDSPAPECHATNDPQCNASTTSADASSVKMQNNAYVGSSSNLAGVQSAGKIYLANNAKVWGTTYANASQVADPYASLSVSVPTASVAHTVTGSGTSGSPYAVSVASGSCSTASITYKNNKYVHIAPGCYNGWDFSNNVVVTLDAGTYYVKSALTMGNNATLNATGGTTIVVSGLTLDVGNNATWNITAPGTYSDATPYQGIAIMSDPADDTNITHKFDNNAVLNVKGAIYFRNQIMYFENNAGSDSDGCLQLIGRRVLFDNNANVVIGHNCTGIGITDFTYGQTVTTITTPVTTTTTTTDTSAPTIETK